MANKTKQAVDAATKILKEQNSKKTYVFIATVNGVEDGTEGIQVGQFIDNFNDLETLGLLQKAISFRLGGE